MDHFPVLETERFVLRELRTEDAPDVFRYFSMDEVTQYYDLESFSELGQAEQLIGQWREKFRLQEEIRWGITYRTEDRIIGTCGFHHWNKAHYKAEIGYELDPQYWRQGVMTEVLGTIMRYGFASLGLNRIEAMIDPDNISSRKLLAKSGMTEEGRLRDYYFAKNQFVDAVIFAMLKRELASARLPAPGDA